MSPSCCQDFRSTSHYLVKARRCRWTWSSLLYRQLSLLNIPHFFTCFQMDLEALGSILSPANIAHQRSRLLHSLLLLHIFSFFLFNPSRHTRLTPFQMLFQAVWQESPCTPRTRNQCLRIVIIECSFIHILNVGMRKRTILCLNLSPTLWLRWHRSPFSLGFQCLFILPLFDA